MPIATCPKCGKPLLAASDGASGPECPDHGVIPPKYLDDLIPALWRWIFSIGRK
ncbi:hypothetical protein [Shimia ponticola]|uniref:hypothetical protein n=1 Tax=Shimia ponticola TaxID=2582893 RepID=UPI001C9AABD1|nr:hypothetical protein [Shimia ponticola]